MRCHLLPPNLSSAKKLFWKDTIQTFLRRVKARFKIYVTLYQILLVLPFVFDFKFPNMYTVSMSFFEILGASVENDELGTTCMWKGKDYVDSLIVGTVYPIVLTVLLMLAYLLHCTCTSGVESELSDLRSRYFSAFLYLTYLILPV